MTISWLIIWLCKFIYIKIYAFLNTIKNATDFDTNVVVIQHNLYTWRNRGSGVSPPPPPKLCSKATANWLAWNELQTWLGTLAFCMRNAHLSLWHGPLQCQSHFPYATLKMSLTNVADASYWGRLFKQLNLSEYFRSTGQNPTLFYSKHASFENFHYNNFRYYVK